MEKKMIIKLGTEMSLKFKQSALHSWYILQPMHILSGKLYGLL